MTKGKKSQTIEELLKLLPLPEAVREALPLYAKWLSSLKDLFDLRRDEFGASSEFIEWTKPLFEFLYSVYFRVKVEGIENIPTDGPVILAANHSGALPYDGAMTHIAVYNEHKKKRAVKFLVDSFAWNLPFVGGALERLGGVVASFDSAQKLLAKKQIVMIFPEGVDGIGKTYDERYKLRPFSRAGFVRLAIRSKAPIVPVSIVGAEEIHPIVYKCDFVGKLLGLPFIPVTPTFPWLGPLGVIPLPSKWKISFMKPVRFTGVAPAKAKDDEFVAVKAEAIRKTIQTKLSKEIKKRKSIWI